MNGEVTLQDVAKEAGVHASTASRALNPATRSSVSAATVDRVVEAANRLAYRPHAVARSLRTNRTMTVGMILPDLENPLFPPIVRGVESVLEPAGYSILIANTDNDGGRLRSYIGTLIAQRVDGLILATALAEDDLVSELVERQVPIVLVNRGTEGGEVNSVVGADDKGIALAVEHLVSLGHTRIGHVAGPSTLSTGTERRTAFMAAAKSAGLDVDETSIEAGDSFTVGPGAVACDALLERRPDITAIVAANDLLALGCYDAIRARGLRVPNDISVTGYNDSPFMDRMDPPLTTVSAPYREMGRLGGEALLNLMAPESDTAPTPPQTVRLMPALTVRSSTQAV